MIRCTIPLSPTLATLAQEPPVPKHPTRESLGDMPINPVKMTLDPEEAPAVPADPDTQLRERLDQAQERAVFWEDAYHNIDRITDDARFVQHARYKTALYVLGGCLLFLGLLLLALHIDMRKGADQ